MEQILRTYLEGGSFSNVSAQRSAAMRAVKSSGNRSTETRLRAMLVRAGIRGWRICPAGLPGRPDFTFPEHRIAIFTDGCFWHGCETCRHSKIRTNAKYWTQKVLRNKTRDEQNTQKLIQARWCVLRFWEHELKSPQEAQKVISLIKSAIANPSTQL